MRKRLWLGAAGVALFIGTIFAARAVLPGSPVPKNVGLDFIAFYTAGQFVREGRTGELYDLSAVKHSQHELARGYGVEIGEAYGPWWNPPFYALLFVPFAMLPYPAAVQTWVWLSLLCVGASCWLLCRMLPKGTGWRSWALVPVLIGLSAPLILATTHGQNSGMSLLLLTIVVTLWRNERGLWAGVVGGLLFYKPQLASVVALVLIVDLGWKSAIGYATAASSLLLINVLLLPGTLSDWLHRMPQNLHAAQTLTPYLWERHVTFRGFWRLLIQGRGKGETWWICNVLTVLSSGTIALALVRAIFAREQPLHPLPPVFDPEAQTRRGEVWGEGDTKQSSLAGESDSQFPLTPTLSRGERGKKGARDGIISATLVVTPLIVPFYFDYDLLLLAIPAVLLASDLMRRDSASTLPRIDRWLLRIWPVLHVWLMLNPDVAERTRINFAVPLLTSLSCLLIARIPQPQNLMVANPKPLPALARTAA